MKGFAPFTADSQKLAQGARDLRQLLKPGAKLSLDENLQLSPFFKNAPDVVARIAMDFGGVESPDLLAPEHWILDKLRCDFAVCNSRRQRFCFIELEDATPQSIFTERKPDAFNGLAGRAPYFDWAHRFEHGTSQIFDWIKILHDQSLTQDFKNHYGERNSFQATYVLVAGREEYLDQARRDRLVWRSKHTIVDGSRIQSITYDDVLKEIEYVAANYPTVAAAAT